MHKLQFVRFVFALACAVPFAGHAMYDPAPLVALAAVEGTWQGTLQYRDYQPPNKRVTLPTRVYVAAASPRELALHYVFNDGPAKQSTPMTACSSIWMPAWCASAGPRPMTLVRPRL